MTGRTLRSGALELLAARFSRRGARPVPRPDAEAEARASRERIDCMLERRPGAFTSELDIELALLGLR